MSPDALDSAHAVDPEFLKDVRILTSDVHFKHVESYIKTLLSSIGAGSVPPDEITCELFAKEHNLKLPNVIRVFRSLTGLAKWIADSVVTDTSFSDQKSQINRLVSSDPKIALRLNDTIEDLVQLRKQLRLAWARSEVISGVLPMFKDFGATIEARAIWKNKDQGMPDLVPLASMLFSLDSGNPSGFTFQITERQLEMLVRELNTIQEQMKKLRLATAAKEDN